MALKDKLQEDLKTAMKAKDDKSKRGIRAIKNALLLAATDGSGEAMTDEKEIKLLQKLVKQRKESVAIYEQNDREDLAAPEREEIEVISHYLPEPLGQDELDALVKQAISEVQAESMRDMGKVIGKVNQQAAGRADGKTIAATVKRLLA